MSGHPEATIAVLMGGPSCEHAISLNSGQGVLEALRKRGWAAEPVVIPPALTVEQACEMVASALRRLGADLAFLALHGPFGEDGTIQHLCDTLQMPYTGSEAAASRLGMDKVASRRRFEAAGLSVPRWQVVDVGISNLEPGWSYPLVVKPIDQGSSLGVSKVERPAGLAAALATAARYGPQALIEEFIAGRELTAGVLEEQPLPVVEIRPRQPFFDFTAKYTQGATEYLVPAPLPPEVTARVQAAGRAAHQALGCRHLSRTDLILTPQGVPVVLEINTIPGFTPTSLVPKAAACLGISYEELCERLILMAQEGVRHFSKREKCLTPFS